MLAVQETSRTQATVSVEEIDAYIEKVMRELLYPVFLRERIRKKVYEFLCSETGLDTAFSEIPADQFGFRIGEPRDAAREFAAKCNCAWLRGAMPVWQKCLIAAVLVVLLTVTALFAVRVADQWSYDHGYWTEKEVVVDRYFDSPEDLPSNVRIY